MTEWYQQPYPTGPPRPTPGFPRALYPPDAANQGYAPSPAGPDVEAYKRTVSRAARWPWQEFDATFSNNFSHGSSSNVGESGIAGIQRQQGIDPTGYVGKATFDVLCRIKIPAGLPHAGQFAMDATAQNLIAEAYLLSHPLPPPAATVRQAALNEAVKHLGYKESPRGSNNTMFGRWYGVNYQPWCATFVTYCFEVGTKEGSPSFLRGSRYAYVPYVVNDARAGRNGLSLTTSPIPGDLVCYDWDGGVPDHIGIFESGDIRTWRAIEGNTSTSNNSNGGEVMRRTRTRSQVHQVYFVRVAERKATA